MLVLPQRDRPANWYNRQAAIGKPIPYKQPRRGTSIRVWRVP